MNAMMNYILLVARIDHVASDSHDAPFWNGCCVLCCYWYGLWWVVYSLVILIWSVVTNGVLSFCECGLMECDIAMIAF